jgi:hypothetical protein
MISSRIAAGLAAGVLATAGLGLAAGPADASTAARTTVHNCGTNSLIVTASREQGATGHANFVLRFKNWTHHSCKLRGYPGLDAVNNAGHSVAHARRTLNGFTGGSRHGIRTIVLKHNDFASADVEWHNFNFQTGNKCKSTRFVAATPANTSDTVLFHRPVTVCGLQVHPTVAGRSGNS